MDLLSWRGSINICKNMRISSPCWDYTRHPNKVNPLGCEAVVLSFRMLNMNLIVEVLLKNFIAAEQLEEFPTFMDSEDTLTFKAQWLLYIPPALTY
jgi:hypothetical protein